MEIETLVQRLQSGDAEMYTSFLFNIDMARSLMSIDTATASNVIQAGCGWNGGGWNTSTASKKLWEQIKLPLVHADFTEYRNTWLFALALAFQIEVPQVALADRAADVAFRLMEKIVEPHNEDAEMHDADARETEDEMLPWEESVDPLPKELAYLWTKASQGDRLELAELLDEFPRFKELPLRAPDNNHRPSNADKGLKVVQQGLLHTLSA